MAWFIIAAVIVLLAGFAIFFGAPYVPSQRKYVRRAFAQLYKVTTKDVLIDVGSGDGLVLRLAAQRGATAIGYEINPGLVVISRLLSLRYKKVSIQLANFWRVELPSATTVVYIFGVSRDGKRFIRKLQAEATRLGHPLTLICYGSPLADLKPEKTFEAYHLYTFDPLQS